MSDTIRMMFVGGLCCVVLTVGCGKGPHSVAGTHGKGTQAAVSDSAGSDTAAGTAMSEPPYKTSYDAKAVYGTQDLPQRGSYLKVDWSGLNADQMNRVIHRLRTEFCTCGCKGDLIDQCLVNDPSCDTAVTLAKQIIREEKMK